MRLCVFLFFVLDRRDLVVLVWYGDCGLAAAYIWMDGRISVAGVNVY